ncbi:hypothetical protein BSKO_11381 [Bryopsis sp. KO-2023]|nr:hypothetical protein BSKO_11381 [Bryopsis sp. KO-2023]
MFQFGEDMTRKTAAAAGASVLSVLVTTPLDVIKNRMQAQQAAGMSRRVLEPAMERFAMVGCPTACPRVGNAALPPICPPECYVYESTLDAVRKIARQEGTQVLWRGTREGLMIAIPMVGIYLPLYDSWVERCSWMGHYAPVVAGAGARTISLFFVAPLDILRLRVQVATSVLMKGESGNAAGRVSDWRNFDWGQGKGLAGRARALWRGYGASVARDVPFSGMYWGLLEPIRKTLLAKCGDREPTLTEVLTANSIAGAVSGTISSGLTTPLDVVKTRQQIIGEGSARPPSVHQLLYDVGRNEGMRGLFSGVAPRCMRAAPSCAIVLSIYELLKRML